MTMLTRWTIDLIGGIAITLAWVVGRDGALVLAGLGLFVGGTAFGALLLAWVARGL